MSTTTGVCLLMSVLVSIPIASCAGTPSRPAAQDSMPELSVSFAPGAETRFRRVVTSKALTEGVPLPEGVPHGIDARTETAYVLRVPPGSPSDARRLEIRIDAYAVEENGLRGNLSFDSTRPETFQVLSRDPGGKAMLDWWEKERRNTRRYAIAADGNPDLREEGVVSTVNMPDRPVSWHPGTLPFARLEGAAAQGTAVRFKGALLTAFAGMRYDEAIPIEGDWRVASWDPEARIARLHMEGKAALEETRLRTTRVAACDVRGEATWDAVRGVVTSSTFDAHVDLRGTETPSLHIDWTYCVEDRLDL
jgi:hypothetical protein